MWLMVGRCAGIAVTRPASGDALVIIVCFNEGHPLYGCAHVPHTFLLPTFAALPPPPAAPIAYHLLPPLRLGCPASVFTLSGTMSTAGTTLVNITGANLGVDPSVVSISYSGGTVGYPRRTYTPPSGTCIILKAGTHIQCATVPGVGANYTFTVTVDGGVSPPSGDAISYTAPSVGSVYGPGAARAPAVNGGFIFLSGTGFGPTDGSTSLAVWAVPTADDSLAFPATNCIVFEAHVTLRCTLGNVMGASLTWRVAVEGQNNTQPMSSVAPPVVTGVAFAGARVEVAATGGGTGVIVEGLNFGVGVDRTRVTVTLPWGPVDATGCKVLVPDTALRCSLPPGVGTISSVGVTVLGQTGWLAVPGLAYARPTVSSVSPPTWPTDVTPISYSVSGSGFGSPALSGLVSVTATPMGSLCTDPTGAAPVVLNATSLSVLSDDSLSFVLRTPATHVTAGWVLGVVVAGQGADTAAAAMVTTRPPSTLVVGLAAGSNATHRFLSLVGTNYGPAVSPTCGSAVTVTVSGQPCANLTMSQVGVGLRWAWVVYWRWCCTCCAAVLRLPASKCELLRTY